MSLRDDQMNRGFDSVPKHILGLGLGALAHANWHANYWSPHNDYWAELSVLQAAHACELLIKARIAEEHPLLIFERFPESSQVMGDFLDVGHLAERGRTFQYADLPERLWATTGLRLPNLERYQAFGRLRNTLQHFAAPSNVDFSQETLEFIYSVVDPFINQCWGLFAVDFNEDDPPYEYLMAGLIRRRISFLVSTEAAKDLKHTETEWDDDEDYKNEMLRRFTEAWVSTEDGQR